ncbi:hypothetical protein B5S30_g5068 [[Candida] boidinii]|nr:hypothetical protein B5S30_g5068 [[Candida] boidinii]
MDVDIEDQFAFGFENFVYYEEERKNEWLKHCHREMANLTGNGIVEELEATSIPAGSTILTSYWKFIIHYDRSLDSYILVEDAEQTERMESTGHTPTKNYDTLKCLLCIVGINRLEMRIMKVKKAYDNAIDSEVYVRPPEEPELVKNKVWRVKKAMRGMRQYTMIWYQRISQYLEGQGLCKSSIDGCLFSGEGCHALVHVYGYMTMLNGNLIKWGSMKATFRTRDSEFAAEYVAMKEAMKSNVEIEKILNEVGVDVGATIICSEYPEAISGVKEGNSGISGKEDGYVMGKEELEECYRYVRDVNKSNKYEFRVIRKENNIARLMSYVLGLEEFQHYMRLVDEYFDNHWEEEKKKEEEKEEKEEKDDEGNKEEKEEKEEIEKNTTELIGKLSV